MVTKEVHESGSSLLSLAVLAAALLLYSPFSAAQFQGGLNMFAGTKTEAVVDFAAPGGHLGLKRYYTSARVPGNSAVSFGANWRHIYDSTLSVSPEVVAVNRPTGNRYLFRGSGSTWAPDPDVKERLSAVLVAGQIAEFRLQMPDNTVEVYSATGRLERIEYADGDALTVSRNVAGQVASVADRKGRDLVFTYDGSRLVQVALPDGRLVRYAYDSELRLAFVAYQVTDGGTPMFATNQYHYGSGANANRLTSIVDEGQQTYAAWTYDDVGRVTSGRRGSTDGPIGLTQIAYGSGQSSVTNPQGETVKSTFSIQHGRAKPLASDRQCSTCGGSAFMTRTYDANGSPDVVTDFNGVSTDYNYNSRGLIETEVEAANKPGAKRVTQTSWHASLRLPTARSNYDAAGVLKVSSSWTYNVRGQSLTSTQLDPATNAVRSSAVTYCEQVDITAGNCPLPGLAIATNGPRTDRDDTTTYQYYATEHADCATSPTTCAWRKGDVWKVTNALGQVTETLRYDGAGRVLSVKDANSIVTDFEYHPRGWLTARKVRGADTASETDDQITRIAYYPTGLVSSTTLPDGSFTSYVYDAAHRLTDIVDADGNRIHYTLDNAGNRTKEEVKGSDDSLKRTLSRVYNQLGQLQTAKDAGNHPTGFTYDANGNTDTVTDALGRVTDNDYDPLNRLSKTIQDVAGIAATTQFKYDAQDHLTEVVDPKGLSTKYQYNAFGDLKRLESADTGVATYDYDAAGNRTSALDARGEQTTFSYDALNRLTAIGYSDTALNVGYTYDAVQPECIAGETFAVGRLTRMTDGSGATRYCYDRFGNLTRKVQTTNGQTFTLRYSYTKAGQLAGIAYPDGTQVDYVRDGLGRATEVGVTPSGGSRQVLLTGASYHPFGPVAGWTFGNGRTISRTLDLDYRPKTILSTGTGAGGLNLGFGWDAVGNVASLHTSGLEQLPRVSFNYDTLNRLTAFRDGAAGAAIEQYAYDATGNRTSFTNAGGTEVYTYPANSHHLSAVGATARTYDAMGNTTSIGGTAREFAYNAAGRMSEVQRDNVVAMQYGYNGRGEQVRKHLGASNTYALYDESGQWLGEYGNTGAPNQQIIWLDSLPVGVIANGQLSYIEADHLGTPRAVIEPQRDVAVWTWDIASEAFGNSPPSQDPDGDNAAFALDMRFPGQRYDSSSGLNYNYFREYDVASGRYVQSDPLGLLAGVSTFGYVGGSPMLWADLYGLLQWSILPSQWPAAEFGDATNLYPGGAQDIFTEGTMARTTMHWDISSRCSCSGAGFALDEFSVTFEPRVLMRQSYASRDVETTTRREELQHVRDLTGWAKKARSDAADLEARSKLLQYPTREDCEKANSAAMYGFLKKGIVPAIEESARIRHANGGHRYVPPET